MDCKEISFSGHAVRRMFERRLRSNDIRKVIIEGETIANYPDDNPYPSRLLLGFIEGQPVHVVVARDDKSRHCFVVTAYWPELLRWSDDFRTRR